MSDFVTEFLSLSTVVFCLAVVAITWVQRKGLELAAPALTQAGTKLNKWWTEFLVPLSPLATGAAFAALVSSYPYPDMFTSLGSRAVYGIVCGLLSGFVYRIVWKNLLDKAGKQETPPQE